MTTDHAPGPRPRPRPAARSAGITTILSVLLMLALAACSGGGPASSDDVATLVDPSASPDPSPSASLDPEAAMQAFATCMRERGIDIQISSAGENSGGFVTNGTAGEAPPSGGPKPGTDKTKAEFDAANKACASLLPKGGVNGPTGEMDPEMEQKMLAFAACMRDHGIAMADPQFSDGGATVQLGGPGDEGSNIDPTSEVFKDAQKACESLLPDDLSGGGGPATQGSKP